MAKNAKKTMGRGKKFLLGLGIVVLLIVLFFLSFWITTLSLRSNQNPTVGGESGTPVAEATATPEVNYKKLSKKELIALLEEKDERIEELSEALGLNAVHTQAPIEESNSSSSYSSGSTSKPTPAAKETEKPAEPTKAPASKPASTPTPTPKPVSTPTPTPKPTATPTPTPAPAEPTPAPATKAPSIKPVAPAADGE